MIRLTLCWGNAMWWRQCAFNWPLWIAYVCLGLFYRLMHRRFQRSDGHRGALGALNRQACMPIKLIRPAANPDAAACGSIVHHQSSDLSAAALCKLFKWERPQFASERIAEFYFPGNSLRVHCILMRRALHFCYESFCLLQWKHFVGIITSRSHSFDPSVCSLVIFLLYLWSENLRVLRYCYLNPVKDFFNYYLLSNFICLNLSVFQ